MMEQLKRLRHLLSMPRAEVVSRVNAWAEVQAAGRDLSAAIENGDTTQTSAEVAAIAGHVLTLQPMTFDPARSPVAEFNELLEAAQSLAGSALAQYPGDHSALPLDSASVRAFLDAQRTGQADPLTRTVVIAPYGSKPNGEPKNLEELD